MLRRVIIFILFATFSTSIIFAQQRKQTNDTLDGQEVNVVKPYSPKISDAFKVKEIPSISEEATISKKEVKYNIFSIPVASTFTPAKGKAAAVEKAKKEELYDNFLTFGAGSYTTLLGELYLNHALNRTENVGGYVSHHSSQGGINDVLLDNQFSDSKIRLNYARNLNSYSWNVDAGYRHQVYNWYGLPPDFTPAALDTTSINPQQKFFTFDFGGEVEFDDSVVNDARLRFRRFADDYDSAENRFMFQSNFDIPLRDGELNTTIRLDYLNGNFDRNYLTMDELRYGNFQLGVTPSYQLIKDDLTVNLGASIFYLNDTEQSDNKFFIYPNITASYRLANEVLIGYAGIEGDLIQNNYHDFAQENPFVSPTLNIIPTDQQYHAYLGLKGKLSNNMSYNVRGSYKAANNQPLFKSNAFLNASSNENYQFGNSFEVLYDDVKTVSIFGEINVDVNRNFNLGIKAEYFNYSTEDQEEAWNLPDFKGSLFLDYQIDEHWFAGANLFYIGERFDQLSGDPSITGSVETISLESFFDANAHVGYRINDRWSVYAKANNIANQDYQRYLNFPVQGIQLLGGMMYKFDF